MLFSTFRRWSMPGDEVLISERLIPRYSIRDVMFDAQSINLPYPSDLSSLP